MESSPTASTRRTTPAGFAARISILGLVCAAVVSGTQACQREYPLEPTFCDRWCEIGQQVGCERPAGCVRDCELSKASEGCFALQQELLECYQAEPPESFTCIDNETHPRGTTCRSKRDEMFECEAPGIGQCLSLCRLAQDTPGINLPRRCTLLTESCEDICFVLLQFQGNPALRNVLPGVTPNADAGVFLPAANSSATGEAPINLLPPLAGTGSPAMLFGKVFPSCATSPDAGLP
jgi:hypothetical protein